MENTDKLIPVFDMLNDRLYKIEIGVEKMITFTKTQCDKRDRFRPGYLFDYPFDVKLNSDQNVGGYNNCCMIEMNEFRSYKILDANVEEIVSMLPNWIKPEFVDRVAEALLYNSQDIPDRECKTIMCEDIGLKRYGYDDALDYITSKYVQKKCEDVFCIVPAFEAPPLIFLRNMKNTDHAVETLIKLLKKFKVESEVKSVTLTAMSPSSIDFYILLVGQCGKETAKYIVNKKCIDTYIRMLRNMKRNSGETTDVIVKDLIDDEKEFQTIMNLLYSLRA